MPMLDLRLNKGLNPLFYLIHITQTMKLKTKTGIAKAMPLGDIQENSRWLKVIAVISAGMVIVIFATALWLKSMN